VLRLPKFALARPTTVAQAIALLEEAGPSARVIAGGTDLVPNMKHEIETPALVVSLGEIAELRGLRREQDGALVIGAMTSLADVAAHELVLAQAPALAQACALVAGPQLRTMGTLGGNVMLDTRCQWINQSYFWRAALGFCLKKDGSVCHVVAGGKNCVAAASNDSAPALMTLGAMLEIEGPAGRRSVAIDDFWLGDGIRNKVLGASEIVARIRVPATPRGHRGAYGKLRDRGSIDFPLLGVAVRLDVDAANAIQHADVVVTALAAQPKRVAKVIDLLRGLAPDSPRFAEAAVEVAALAHKQCRPLANIPGDADYRREMVPVYVKRTLLAAANGSGPVHHV
jgi:4-hydroxybenzoyl-CoA reductase subunit beta